jgi:IS605 OrfB family transposase
MKQTLTLVCKLHPTPEQVAKIEATLKAFADGCNYVNQVIKPNITNKVAIQAQAYEQLRQQFGLAANLAVRVCARVATNRKTAKVKGKSVRAFQSTSADYDARIFAFREKDWAVSLTLVGGREHISMQVGNYQIGKLKGRKPTSATLAKHRDGLYYIHIQLTDEVPDPIKSDNVIGVDFGRRSIAVTSNGDEWDGKPIQKVRDKFAKARASVQKRASKGTRSSRRRCRQLLKRLSGKEQRFQSWLNHNISRAIIKQAKSQKAIVAIEDLTGIRHRTNTQPRSRTERRRSNSWAFFQLRFFLEYKGIQAGVEVVAVPPQYTSQTCNQCLHIGLRSNKTFKCGNCSWHGDADFNGSMNIAAIGAVVSLLRGSDSLSCVISSESSGLLKAPGFDAWGSLLSPEFI